MSVFDRYLDDTSQKVLTVIANLGGITKKQVQVILGDEDKGQRVLSNLILQNLIRSSETVPDLYYPITGKPVSSEMVTCIWFAIELSRGADKTVDLNLLSNAFRNNPVKICLSTKTKYCNIVFLPEEEVSSKLPVIIDRYKSYFVVNNSKYKPEADGAEYYLLSDSKSAIRQILEYNMPFRHNIILAESAGMDESEFRLLEQ